MTSFANILLVANGSKRDHQAFRLAARLARSSHTGLTVLSALHEVPERGLRLLPGLETEMIEQARARLAAFLDNQAPTGVAIQSKVVIGPPAVEIIREVLRANHGLVIKAAEKKRGAIARGSIDQRLLRMCPCPVWILKSGSGEEALLPGRILAAVDPAANDPRSEGLNQQILDLAGSLARASDDARVHVVHAYRDKPPRFSLRLDHARRAEFSTGMRRLAETDVERLLEKSSIESVPHETHFVAGSAHKAILKVAKDTATELIVLGTIGRSGLSGYLVGNTCERVLAKVKRSVLAVKPPGFVTPVSLTD